MLKSLFALVLLGIVISDLAAAYRLPPRPNCPAAEFHQLDFWLGDWDTQDSDSKDTTPVARTHVDPIATGCAMHELYEQTDGLIGDSILSYDATRSAVAADLGHQPRLPHARSTAPSRTAY